MIKTCIKSQPFDEGSVENVGIVNGGRVKSAAAINVWFCTEHYVFIGLLRACSFGLLKSDPFNCHVVIIFSPY
jgi:hypothetical protein